jgi:hypothetical protein
VNDRATSSSSVACASSRSHPSTRRLAPAHGSSFLGDDADGIALEAMAIELDDENLLVIHAMPLRDCYRRQYEEAVKWRK